MKATACSSIARCRWCPQDTNGRQDVYEWEREGTGTCTAASAVNGGCIYLLSGGTSEADSWFIGSSESGDDVFVASRAHLAPQDGNEAFNLFDARVGRRAAGDGTVVYGHGLSGSAGARADVRDPGERDVRWRR